MKWEISIIVIHNVDTFISIEKEHVLYLRDKLIADS